LVTRKGSSL